MGTAAELHFLLQTEWENSKETQVHIMLLILRQFLRKKKPKSTFLINLFIKQPASQYLHTLGSGLEQHFYEN